MLPSTDRGAACSAWLPIGAFASLPAPRLSREIELSPPGDLGPRNHDLWLHFASRALALGESLSMIGKLLGHNKIDTTFRYAHPARDSIKASSARVADSIDAYISDRRPTDGTASA